MPAVPRSVVIDESKVGSYHIQSRAVRRGFLLGFDLETGRDHPHRQRLLVRRLELLSSIFAVECLDVAAQDSSFDLILRNRPDVVSNWSDREVAERWLRLHRSQVELREEATWEKLAALLADEPKVGRIRRRLSSISWFMAYLKEPLAKRFNREDGVDGHFWAERFGCVKLRNEVSLLACSSYVSISAVLAGETKNAELASCSSLAARVADERLGSGASSNPGGTNSDSMNPDATSPEAMNSEGPHAEGRGSETHRGALSGVETDRIGSEGADTGGRDSAGASAAADRPHSGWLAALGLSGDGYAGAAAGRRATDEGYLPLTLAEYREVVAWLAERELAERAGELMSSGLPALFERLGISAASWELELREVRRRFARSLERAARMRAEARRRSSGSSSGSSSDS